MSLDSVLDGSVDFKFEINWGWEVSPKASSSKLCLTLLAPRTQTEPLRRKLGSVGTRYGQGKRTKKNTICRILWHQYFILF